MLPRAELMSALKSEPHEVMLLLPVLADYSARTVQGFRDALATGTQPELV